MEIAQLLKVVYQEWVKTNLDVDALKPGDLESVAKQRFSEWIGVSGASLAAWMSGKAEPNELSLFYLACRLGQQVWPCFSSDPATYKSLVHQRGWGMHLHEALVKQTVIQNPQIASGVILQEADQWRSGVLFAEPPRWYTEESTYLRTACQNQFHLSACFVVMAMIFFVVYSSVDGEFVRFTLAFLSGASGILALVYLALGLQYRDDIKKHRLPAANK